MAHLVPRFELYCDDPRHGKDRHGKVREVVFACFVKRALPPTTVIAKRVAGDGPLQMAREPAVWQVDPGATAERRKRQRAWIAPEPTQTPPNQLSFDQLMASIRPNDDNKLGIYEMIDGKRLRPYSGVISGRADDARQKFEKVCTQTKCPRLINRYLSDLGELFDLLLSVGWSRINLATLDAMLAEQAKRKR